MADSKSGPVKPPVIDLTARDASGTVASTDKATKPASVQSEGQPEPKAKPLPRPEVAEHPLTKGFGFGPMLAGAALGLVSAYSLAFVGWWPIPATSPPPPDPRVAVHDKVLPELRTIALTTQSELATLTQRVRTLEAAPAPGSAVPAADLVTLQADFAALATRIDALPQAVSVAPDPAIAGTMEALKTALSELGARVGSAEASLSRLGQSVEANEAAMAGQPVDINSVLQLPLILSGLEVAFANGRPYETELAALRAGMPDADVPTEIANNASGGLTRGDAIAARFAAVLPDILAGRPADPNASWQDATADWFRSMLALRPTSAVAGDDPEAVVSRLEAAIAQRDFAAAQALFEQLPTPMVVAAAEVPGQISAQAAAAKFLDNVRQQALAEAAK